MTDLKALRKASASPFLIFKAGRMRMVFLSEDEPVNILCS
jgi:hypothetical protein